MIQAMQILQLPSLDLSDRIEQELVENPFLEVQEPSQESRDETASAEETRSADLDPSQRATEEQAGVEGMIDLLERYERDFGDGQIGGSRMGSMEDTERKYEAMQNTAESPAHLADALLAELAYARLDEESRSVLEYVVWSLDERGYLRSDPETIAAEIESVLGRPVETVEIEVAIEHLRRATHPSIAARDLRECLLLQLDHQGERDPLVVAIVADHLEDVENNRLPRIAKATGHSIDEVKEALDLVRGLDPIPGAAFGGAPAQTITPDVIVEEIDGDYQVRLDRERVPELVISPAYKRLLQQARKGDGVKEWVKKRLESARWFIDAVQQRQSTLERIARVIFTRQRGYLDRGPAGLVPLRMQEVADEVGVHISTVSRAVSGKYAQTPRGIEALKFFFTGGTTKTTGEMASQVSIKERIKDIVDKEDKQKPLSDDQIAAKLTELDGIQIARRTVSKYRKALSIASSTQRREY